MSITFVGSESNSSNGTGSVAVNVPAGVQDGDLLVAIVSEANNGDWNIPSGWTRDEDGLLVGGGGGSKPETDVFIRTAPASPPSSYTFTNTGTNDIAGIILAYRGVNSSPYLDAAVGTANGNAVTDANPPSVTTVTDGARVIAVGINDDGITFTSPPSGYTMRENVNVTSGAGVTLAAADMDVPTAGAEDPGTFTPGSASNWAAITIALRPKKTVDVGLATENESAHSVTSRLYLAVDLGEAVENESVFGATPVKYQTVGLASENDSLLGVTPVKYQIVGIPVASEFAYPMTPSKAVWPPVEMVLPGSPVFRRPTEGPDMRRVTEVAMMLRRK